MDALIINLICFVVFPIALLSMTRLNFSQLRDDILSKEDSLTLRAIGGLFVLLAHDLTLLSNLGFQSLHFAKALTFLGGLGVCVFFFASGYGLQATYAVRDMSCKDYFRRRFDGVIPTLLLVRFISLLALRKWENGAWYAVLYLLNLKSPAWFVSEIIVMYVLCYFAFRISKERAIIIMTLLLAAMSVCFAALNFEARWYNANLVFCVGMLAAKRRVSLIRFLQTRFWLKLSLLLFAFLPCGSTKAQCGRTHSNSLPAPFSA